MKSHFNPPASYLRIHYFTLTFTSRFPVILQMQTYAKVRLCFFCCFFCSVKCFNQFYFIPPASLSPDKASDMVALYL